MPQLMVQPKQEFAQRGLTVRPITPADEEFLYILYASSREAELSVVAWEADFREKFLRQQFKAQHEYYHEHFIDPEFLMILLQGEQIGRIYIDRRPQELALAEITLVPEYRNQGIGSVFIRDLMVEAAETGLPLRLHVEHFNRAKVLYTRLGFYSIKEDGVYAQMEWRSETAPTTTSS